MTYTIKDLFGNQKAEVLTPVDLFNLKEGKSETSNWFFNILRGELEKELSEIKKILKDLRALKKEYEELNKKKAQKVNQEIKTFETEFKIFKEKNLKELKEIEVKIKTLNQEAQKQYEQAIKKLDSEILKKVPAQIRPEDLDTLEICKNFYNRLINSKKEEKTKLYTEIRDMIPKLNLLPVVKFKILNGIGDDSKTIDRFRFVIDRLQSGLEIKSEFDMKDNPKTSKGKQEEVDEYYGN